MESYPSQGYLYENEGIEFDKNSKPARWFLVSNR